MNDIEFILWLAFILIFALLPIKPLFRYLFKGQGGRKQHEDTKLYVEEEGYHEKHYSQLYRPGDKKYDDIVEQSNNAKPIN